jgi:hypothetical protein
MPQRFVSFSRLSACSRIAAQWRNGAATVRESGRHGRLANEIAETSYQWAIREYSLASKDMSTRMSTRHAWTRAPHVRKQIAAKYKPLMGLQGHAVTSGVIPKCFCNTNATVPRSLAMPSSWTGINLGATPPERPWACTSA